MKTLVPSSFKLLKGSRRKLVIYHGTSRSNAENILREGFKTVGVKRHWDVVSKDGFVYFSLAYAPFYAMASDDDADDERELALIKVEIDVDDLYPEDDFVMYLHGKGKYTQEELDAIDFEVNKHLWVNSLKYMGNVSAKPDRVKILGVKYFYGRNLIMKCDPVITPMNYKFMGDYYLELTEWIFAGNDILKFKNFMEMEKEDGVSK